MTIHLDTSALVAALAGPRASFDRLHAFVDDSHRMRLPKARSVEQTPAVPVRRPGRRRVIRAVTEGR